MTFIAQLMPSRMDVPEYQEYLERIEALVAVVNHRHGTPDWMPIQLKLRDDLEEAVAAYKHYDVMIVNAMFDGMNLVAKEGPLVNERDGVSILSENTGAHEELGEFALSVNPFDIKETADSIHAALTMSAEERARRCEGLKAAVTARDPGDWIDEQLADIRAKRAGARAGERVVRGPCGRRRPRAASESELPRAAVSRRRTPAPVPRSPARELGRRRWLAAPGGGARLAARRGAARGSPARRAGGGDGVGAARRRAPRPAAPRAARGARAGARRARGARPGSRARCGGAPRCARAPRVRRPGAGARTAGAARGERAAAAPVAARRAPPGTGSAGGSAGSRGLQVRPRDDDARRARASAPARRDVAPADAGAQGRRAVGVHASSRRRRGAGFRPPVAIMRRRMPAHDPLYDLVLMLDSAAPDEQRQKVAHQRRADDRSRREIVNTQDWGVRQTAYEIRHKTDAEYHLLQFHGVREVLETLQRTLRIADGVIRFRIIKLEPGTPGAAVDPSRAAPHGHRRDRSPPRPAAPVAAAGRRRRVAPAVARAAHAAASSRLCRIKRGESGVIVRDRPIAL